MVINQKSCHRITFIKVTYRGTIELDRYIINIIIIKTVRCGPEVTSFKTKTINFSRVIHLNLLSKI